MSSSQSEKPASPAFSPDPKLAAEEQRLKVALLRTQVADAKFKFDKSKRDDAQSRKESAHKLRQTRAAAAKAEVDLESANREARKQRAEEKRATTYVFHEGFTWDNCKKALEDLDRISYRFPGQDLCIVLNSPGGQVIAGLGLYDHIKELRRRGHHVTVKVRGMAASMGGILLQSGDKRVIGPEAMVLIHEVSSGTIGRLHDMADSVEFTKRLWSKLRNILAERSKLTPEEIDKRAYKFDWWLDAKEAVELGFADEIG